MLIGGKGLGCPAQLSETVHFLTVGSYLYHLDESDSKKMVPCSEVVFFGHVVLLQVGQAAPLHTSSTIVTCFGPG